MADKEKKGADRASEDVKGDVNERPLTPKDTEAPAAASPKQQEGANRFAEDSRGRIWGDTTGSGSGIPGRTENNNIDGLHGRDGGFSEGSPNNPAPNEQVDEDAGKTGDSAGEVVEGIKTL